MKVPVFVQLPETLMSYLLEASLLRTALAAIVISVARIAEARFTVFAFVPLPITTIPTFCFVPFASVQPTGVRVPEKVNVADVDLVQVD